MHWLIENNVSNEDQYEAFIESIERLGISYTKIQVIPFSHEVIGLPDIDEPMSVYGSVRLCNILAPERGWHTFSNQNFDYEVWSKHWAGHLLNDDVVIGPFQSIEIEWDEFFIRPCKDNKAFTGTITTKSDYYDWVDKVRIVKASGYGSGEDVNFDLDEMVMVSPVQNIQREVRFYVVDGDIATHSTYKLGSKTQYHGEEFTDTDAIEFVNKVISMWQPDDAFVIDVALVNNEYKIIEINCINCSGLYKSNVGKLAGKLHRYFEDNF
jgi:hypothetical protein